MNCGCVVLFCGGGAGGDDDRDCRGARGTRYRRVVVVVIQGRECRRLTGGWRAGASVYLGPGAGAACRSASTAADCPGSPCPTCPPRSCNSHIYQCPRRLHFLGMYPLSPFSFFHSPLIIVKENPTCKHLSRYL